ncbi:PepSY domain-containing protein [Roseovarius nanhaiticus]|uniref:PepSY domain-containing protein n=1 Tax=Roseovarius nanhaiticus TaxID=573024 RepID=UPI0024904BAD|nr:PepSY domain-containing protein [Roseovarius nanhaiticus]
MKRFKFPDFGKMVLLSAAIVTGGVAAAHAGENGEGAENKQEVQSFLSSPQTLADAIAAAEAKTGARAMDASFEQAKDGSAAYDVELVKADGTQMDVLVDASGTVTMQASDDADEGNDDNDND